MKNGLSGAIERALSSYFESGVAITGRAPLGGGSINRVERVDTTAGSCVLKSNDTAPDGFFQAEADGLMALRASGTPLVVPRVIAVGTGPHRFLLLEYLDPGRRAADFDEQLGTGLALLHRCGAPKFGFTRDNFCGATPQPNPWMDSWLEFFAEARLGHQVRLARDAGVISEEQAAVLDRVTAGLGRWLTEPAEGPALIHGDLWSGNLHAAQDGRPAVIDPAASFGHREAEFGMMLWLGGFSPRVYAAYEAAFPLEPGWRDRHGIYRLYHVLNHANLFGGAYVAEALSIARRFAATSSSPAR